MADYQHTPIASSLYSRYMLDNIDDVDLAKNNTPELFQSFFGMKNGGRTHFAFDDTEFEIEIQRAGTQKLANLIPRGINSTMGTLQERNAESRRTIVARTFPLAEEKSNLTQAELDKMIPGERMYKQAGVDVTMVDRHRYWATRKINEQVVRMKRLYEYLAAQVVLYGTMPAIVGATATDLVYDFRRLATHYVDKVAAKWTTAATDIYGQIDAAVTLIRDDSYLEDPYVVCILGEDVAPGIFANTRIQADLDKRRLGTESIEMHSSQMYPEDVRDLISMYNCRPLGFLTTDKANKAYILMQDRFYHNASGTKTKYLPAKSVLIYSPSVRGDRVFGPHERGIRLSRDRQDMVELFGFDSDEPMVSDAINVGNAFVKESLYFDFSRSRDRKRIEIVTQGAPVFVPYNVNGFVHYYNCA